MTESCVVFDLDGTIANNQHRMHHILTKPKNWPAFFNECVDDTVHEYVRALCNLVQHRYQVFICSGRPDSHRPQTVRWLEQNIVYYNRLLMRTAGDYRPDYVIKKEMLDWIRLDGFEPLFAVDDRPSVVSMWRKNGVPCLVVDDSSWHTPGNEDEEEKRNEPV